jgi:EAL domain-containing protein (putative c-di-GMP-specific phosphodiesterase class I)
VVLQKQRSYQRDDRVVCSMFTGSKTNFEPLARTANPNGHGFIPRLKFASAAEAARSISFLSFA